MQYTPLIQHASSSFEQWRSAVGALPVQLRQWLDRTTSNNYLSSRLSRRGMRKIAVPAWWALMSVGDLVTGASWLPWWGVMAIDLPAVAAFCCLSFQPSHRLCTDMLYALVGGCWQCGWAALLSVTGNQEGLDTLPTALGSVVFAFTAVGVHSSALCALVVISEICFMFLSPALLSSAIAPIACVTLGWIVEMECALAIEELHAERQSTQHLVNGAGDGSCTVSTDDGTILSANAKLEATLAHRNVVGLRLADVVSDRDVPRMAQVIDSVDTPAVFEPFMATFQTAPYEFEAKVIPYKASEEILTVCLQLQGERRFRDIQDAAGRGRNEGEVSLTHPTAVAPDAATTSLGYSETAGASTSAPTQADLLGRERAIQTAARPQRPPLPDWILGREQDDSDYDGGSDHSGDSGEDGGWKMRKRNQYVFDDPPVLPAFRRTSDNAMFKSIEWLLYHWNPPQVRLQRCCCNFHASLHLLSMAAKKMIKKKSCPRNWRPYRTWQCPSCNLMNCMISPECDMCLEEKPRSSGGTLQQTANVVVESNQATQSGASSSGVGLDAPATQPNQPNLEDAESAPMLPPTLVSL